jgi:hypothetical protein
VKIARWLSLAAVALLVAGCGSSGSSGPSGSSGHYTASEVEQAFTQAGLHHSSIDRAPPGVIFNYNKPPHVVSVTVTKKTPAPVVFGHGPHMRVTRLGNVMVYYAASEQRVVRSALNSLRRAGSASSN